MIKDVILFLRLGVIIVKLFMKFMFLIYINYFRLGLVKDI